jgi:MFS family permease
MTVLVTSSTSLPVFTLAASSVLIRADLGFGEASLGRAVSFYFLAAALTSIPAGRLAERIGAKAALTCAALGSMAALSLTAGMVSSYLGLVAVLAFSGVASALAEPASNLALASNVPAARQGIYFGWKQSAIPLAGILAGVLVPVLSLRAGWRWAFGLSAIVPVIAILLQPASTGDSPQRNTRPRANADRQLWLLSATVGLGMAAITAFQTFYVESAVAIGVNAGRAGLLMAMGSGCGVMSRLFFGWYSDRARASPLRTIPRLMTLGGLGYALLAFESEPVLWVGSIVAFVAGWGWTGLFHLSIVRTRPAAPAAASGFTSTGARIGGMVGPALFGAVLTVSTFGWAWIVAGSLLGAAAVTAALAARAVVAADDCP